MDVMAIWSVSTDSACRCEGPHAWRGTESMRVQDTGALSLLGFNGQLGTVPGVPPPFEGVDLGKTFVEQFLCRTGTRILVGSGTVEDQGLVLIVGGS
jgi:hypothetical protein